MNHWPFILGAYALTVLPTLALVWTSFAAMRGGEAEADALKGER